MSESLNRVLAARRPSYAQAELSGAAAITPTGRAALAAKPSLAERILAVADAIADLTNRLPTYYDRGQHKLAADLIRDLGEELREIERDVTEAVLTGEVSA